MAYEKEQEYLLQLWKELEDEEEKFIESESGSEVGDEENIDTVIDTEENEEEQESENEDEHWDDNSEENITEQEGTGTDVGTNKYWKGKDGTKWLTQCGNKRVRTRAVNIITHLPGVKGNARDVKTPLHCWLLFIDSQIISDIARYTTMKIRQKAVNYKDKYFCNDTNEVEIKAVFGLLYLAGVFRSGHRNLEDFWKSDGTGMDIFPATMSAKRFMFLLNCLRFDNFENRSERLVVDKLAPVRAIFDKFVNNCQAVYTPSEYVTLDEKLVSFRGKCSFRQYIPKKPARYGIKIQALVDAKTFYTLNMEVYTGRQPDGPFQISNTPKDIALRMITPISGTNRNVTFDNWYTSYELIQELYEKHKITAVGTIRKNKRQIPSELLSISNRSAPSSLFGFQKNLTLVSYVPKKGKNVLLMSSLHHDDEICKDSDQMLPGIIRFYNSTKSGVDVTDELSTSYNVARNSRRWPLTIMFCLVNTAGINSQVVHKFNTSDYKMKRRNYLKSLGLALVREHAKSRIDNPRITRVLREKINNIFGEHSEEPPTKKQAVTRGRCGVCPRKADKKTKYFCDLCNIYVCLEHSIIRCESCAHNSNSE